MTTSRTISVWTEFDESSQLSKKALGYFRGRLSNKLYQLVISEFIKREAAGFSKAKLARRIRKNPAQITRLLSGPGNWTIDTVSDLLLGMGFEPGVTAVAIRDEISELADGPKELSDMTATRNELLKPPTSIFETNQPPGSSAQTATPANL